MRRIPWLMVFATCLNITCRAADWPFVSNCATNCVITSPLYWAYEQTSPKPTLSYTQADGSTTTVTPSESSYMAVYHARRTVRHLYATFLLRAASEEDIKWRAGHLLRGLYTSSDLMMYLYQSPEFKDAHRIIDANTPTPAQFITMAYEIVLDRSPEPGAIAFYLPQLSANGRDWLFQNFITSAESISRNGSFSVTNSVPSWTDNEGALGGLWHGDMSFQLQESERQDNQNGNEDPNNISGQIVTVGQNQYLFNRDHTWTDSYRPSTTGQYACSDGWVFRYSVRSRQNYGTAFTNKTTIAAPRQDYPSPDGCGIGDGNAFYDAANGTWHLLAQCMSVPTATNKTPNWGICHYVNNNPDPTQGQWLRDFNTIATAQGNELWAQLNPVVAGSSDPQYYLNTGEGTPLIVMKKDEIANIPSPGQSDGSSTSVTRFYVAYHGAREAPARGMVGLAKTNGSSFSRADSDATPLSPVDPRVPESLPGAPLLADYWGGYQLMDATDCQNVYSDDGNQCIGMGHMSVVRDGMYYYILVEAPTLSLSPATGQFWPFLLFRSPRLSKAGTWEPFWGTPMVAAKDLNFPSTAVPELLGYANLFEDGSDVYLSFYDHSYSDHSNRNLFKLAPGSQSTNQTYASPNWRH